MDVDTIRECHELSHSGKISFPEVVKKLSSNGVERYLIDISSSHNTYYGANGESYVVKVEQDLPHVPKIFDAAAVKSAIVDIQKNKIDYPQFIHRIVLAGCCHYEAYLQGRKVIYFGRDGSHHIELFP